MQLPDIFTTLKQFLPHLTWGSAIVFTASSLWGLIKLVNHATTKGQHLNDEWNHMRSNITECNDQLRTAMSNHLPHIEQATERTAAAVEQIAKALQEQAVTSAKMLAVLETQQRYKN
jgi:methyl-accepting chemotaxis protein